MALPRNGKEMHTGYGNCDGRAQGRKPYVKERGRASRTVLCAHRLCPSVREREVRFGSVGGRGGAQLFGALDLLVTEIACGVAWWASNSERTRRTAVTPHPQLLIGKMRIGFARWAGLMPPTCRPPLQLYAERFVGPALRLREPRTRCLSGPVRRVRPVCAAGRCEGGGMRIGTTPCVSSQLSLSSVRPQWKGRHPSGC